VRRRDLAGHYVSLSGADPLNLLGIVTPGPRLPSLTSNRVLYRDGVPVATFAAGEISFLVALDPKEQWRAQNAIRRRHLPALVGSDSGM
jgi:ATP-dependent Lhr-like helicase